MIKVLEYKYKKLRTESNYQDKKQEALSEQENELTFNEYERNAKEEYQRILEELFLNAQMDMALRRWLQNEGLNEDEFIKDLKPQNPEFLIKEHEKQVDFYLCSGKEKRIIKQISTVEYNELDADTIIKLMKAEKICTALFDKVYGKNDNILRKNGELMSETQKLINQINKRQ